MTPWMYNFTARSEAAIRFIEGYSAEALATLKDKRCIPTQCDGLNELLDGGISTQEVLELIEYHHGHTGEVIMHMIVHHLHNDRNAQAVIVTSNGVQNSNSIYRVAHSYLESYGTEGGQISDLDEAAFHIMARVFIVQCTDIKQLNITLDNISKGLFTGTDAQQKRTPRESVPQDVTTSIAEKQGPNTRVQLPGKHLDIVAIHTLSSIIEDSKHSDAWQGMPTVCRQLRTVARRLNAAVIVSNVHDTISRLRSLTANYEPERRKTGIVEVFIASPRWHATVDKRIYLIVKYGNKKANRATLMAQLTKSSQRPNEVACHIELTDKGI
ncbi:uncharacterized protein BXIN_2377 [Babesia sp. Xinjiang]|uniref:uncharacterized protein n=1 Tax=Babesia sp. Xinjiang TaxID=462227 RepID=UPI000A242BAB|nr:uncharacterized protein BXIN_2377 [Babesia sp. Xinjiang]ORM40702.1 hypothetical protein BXIN_2377 [Babesia sp. Xinjiang]